MQQQSNVVLRHAPILPFPPFQLFVTDSSAKSFKCVGKTKRIGPQIVVDMSFNKDMTVRVFGFRQSAQIGQAWSEPTSLR